MRSVLELWVGLASLMATIVIGIRQIQLQRGQARNQRSSTLDYRSGQPVRGEESASRTSKDLPTEPQIGGAATEIDQRRPPKNLILQAAHHQHPSTSIESPIDPNVFAVSWRAVTAYVLGGVLDLVLPGLGFWVGFKFSRSYLPLVRFHAVQACSLRVLYVISWVVAPG
jgi:hypothetical protein